MTQLCPRCAKLLHCGASDYCPQHRECNECEHNETIYDVCDCSFTDLVNHIEMLNTELLEMSTLFDKLPFWYKHKKE